MNTTEKSTPNFLAASSFFGVAQGIAVQFLINPFETVKIIQQSSPTPTPSYRVAINLFKNEPLSAFYRGMQPVLLQTVIKSAWRWPMMTGIPSVLNKFELNPYLEQFATGITISIFDAVISKAHDVKKIRAMTQVKPSFSIWTIHKEEWQGFSTYWGKKSVNWCSFLVAQKFFKERKRAKSGKQDLTPQELMGVGIQTAFVVSLASSPLDYANTVRQIHNLSLRQLLAGNKSKFLTGWPINTTILVIQVMSSVFLLEKLGSHYNKATSKG